MTIKRCPCLFLYILILIVLHAGCSSKPEKPGPSASPSQDATTSPEKAEEKSPDKPEQSPKPLKPVKFKGTFLQSRDGKRKNWTLSAREIKYDEQKKLTRAEVVEAVFFNAKNEPVLTITAKGARVDMKTDSLRFQGSVQAKSNQGESLEVKKLRWDGKEKRLIGEGFIKIRRKGAIMTANRMSADPELKKIKLFGDVSVVYPDAGKFLRF